MVCVEVYTKTTQIKYLSTFCSKASLFVIISRIISIILPLIISYKTKGFWLKVDKFYTQPNIRYTYEYFFYSEDVINNNMLLCSNVVQIEDMIDSCSKIKIHEKDFDYDEKYDELYFNLSINNENKLNIREFVLILGFDILIEDVCPFKFKTFAIIQHSHFNKGQQIYFIGDLKIIQKKLSFCQKNSTYILNKNNFNIWNFLKGNTKKNLSTKIANSHTIWISGTSNFFNMDIILRYPYQLIYYKPTFWQIIKNAWIQYLSVFIAITWIINKIQDYIFTNKLVLYHVDYPNKHLY